MAKYFLFDSDVSSFSDFLKAVLGGNMPDDDAVDRLWDSLTQRFDDACDDWMNDRQVDSLDVVGTRDVALVAAAKHIEEAVAGMCVVAVETDFDFRGAVGRSSPGQ